MQENIFRITLEKSKLKSKQISNIEINALSLSIGALALCSPGDNILQMMQQEM